MQPRPDAPPLELGLLVGGSGKRMGGCDKGMLRAPDDAGVLAERLLRLGSELGLACMVVGGAPGYGARFGVPQLVDEPAGSGPLGGLRALLARARTEHVAMLACDMPYVSRALLQRLVETPALEHAALLAAREPSRGKWQPFFARYRVAATLPAVDAALASGVLSFQTLFRSLEVQELVLSPAEHAELRDWDEPGDLTA
jgi:molybdopterin-guanine dinucleotide biosynthesis protein A